MNDPGMKRAVIAFGGNALLKANQTGTLDQQFENARTITPLIAELVEGGWSLLLTHGNGPQVGNALMRAELAAEQVPPLPLYACGAETQGTLGFLLQQVVGNEFRARGMDCTVASVVTQVRVDGNDPAFSNPSKPIGPFFRAEGAMAKKHGHDWHMIEDAGRGWRRVVPSPTPQEIVEMRAARCLLDAGCVVIAGGGGGVPVVETDSGLHGVDAVIDKDRVSALLAAEINATHFVLLTGVDQVFLGFGTAEARAVPELNLKSATDAIDAGEFPAGSMLPKVEAACDFVRRSGKHALITSPEKLGEALMGKSGTLIVP